MSDGDIICGPCGSYVTKIYCGATKQIKFDKIKGEAIVEHEGVHNCNVKPNKRKKQRIIDKQIMPISGFNTPHKTKKAMMHEKMDKKEYKDVLEIAETLSNDDLKARISRLRRDSSRPLSARDECEVYSHIQRLKKEFQEQFDDPNLIYKECCAHETVGEKGSYIFKTSKTSLEMAAKMGGAIKAKGEDSQLTEEPAYFDDMHTRVRLYKTLMLWAYHPAIRKMMELVIMEAPRENTYYIAKFFQLFQQAIREYLGDETYEWRPNSIMVDEKGSNFVALENVFSKEFVDNYTMTCQYHFKRCADEKMQEENVPKEERKKFCELIKDLLNSSTIPEYHNACHAIEKAVKRLGLEGWWCWWKPRGFHLIPALRGLHLPRSNYAECGQSKLKGDSKISLIESVLEDVCEFLIQAADYKKFLDNSERVRGKGPSQFEREERERREDRRYVESVVEAIRSGKLLESRREVNGQKRFVPGARAKHKAPKDDRMGVQGKTRDSDKNEDDNAEKKAKGRGKKKKDSKHTEPERPWLERCGRGRNPKYDSDDAMFGDSCMDKINPEEDYRNVPLVVELRQIEELQRVEYVALRKQSRTQNVTVCQGCRKGFTDLKFFVAPTSLVFRYKMYRKRPTRDNQWVYKETKSYGYFHAEDMLCI